jgi:hypothetical protein
VKYAIDVKSISPARRNERFEFFVALVGSLSRGPSQAYGDAMYVRVDR